MSLNSVKFVITTTYGILSMIAYFLVDYILLSNRKLFGGSFFRLFLVQSFFEFIDKEGDQRPFQNCLTYFNSMVTLRLPQNTCQNCTLAPIFANNMVPGLQFFHTIHYHMAFVQFFFTAAISGNRFSMMISPFHYEKFWNRAFMPIIIIIVVLPSIATYVFPINHSYYDYVPTSDWYAIKTTADLAVLYNYLIAHMIIITSLSTFFNFGTLALLVVKSRDNRAKKSELLLIVHSFIGFAIEAFSASVTVLNRLAVGLNGSWFMQVGQTLLPFVSDSLTLVHPFLLIACSSSVRGCVRYVLSGQRNRVTEMQSVAPTASNHSRA